MHVHYYYSKTSMFTVSKVISCNDIVSCNQSLRDALIVSLIIKSFFIGDDYHYISISFPSNHNLIHNIEEMVQEIV